MQNKTDNTPQKLAFYSDKAGFSLILFALMIIPVWFNIQSYDQFELPKLTMLRIVTVLTLFFWGLRTVFEGKITYRATPLDIPMVLLVFSNIISTVASFAPNVSYRGEYENFAGSLSNINYIVLYFLAVSFITTRQRFKYAAITLSASTFLVTLYGVAQIFGFDFIKWSEASVIRDRYFASMGNPNFLGALIIMAIPFCTVFAYVSFKKHRYSLSILNTVAVVLMFLALFGTQSRGPFLGFVVSAFMLSVYALRKAYQHYTSSGGEKGILPFILNSIRKHKAVYAILLVVLVFAGIMSVTVGKKATERITSSLADIPGSLRQSRLHIWIPAVNMIKDKPVFGFGVDTFKTIFPAYEGTDFAQIDGANVSSRTAHNEYLNYAATMGFFGLGSYLLLLYAWGVSAARSYRRETDSEMKLYLIASAAAVTAYLTQNFFSFGVAAINVYFYVLLAAGSSHYLLTRNGKKKDLVFFRYPGTPSFLAGALLVVPLIFGIMYFYSFYSADVHYNRGKIYGMNNRWDISINEHLISVKECPNEVKYHVYLGLAYERYAMGLNDAKDRNLYLKTALSHYSNGVRLNPGNSYYWANMGRIYTVLGQSEDPSYYTNALDNFQQAVKRAPVTGLFYNNMMEVYLKTGQPEKASLMLEKVEQYDRKLAANINFNFGAAAFNDKDFRKAYMHFMRCVQLDPRFEPGLYNLGITAATVGDTYTAAAAINDLLRINPNFDKRSEAERVLNDIKKYTR